MKIRNKHGSFVQTCIMHFVIYSLVALGLVLLLKYMNNSILNNALPTMDNLLQYKDKLQRDDYAGIPFWKIRHCEFIVYNNTNQIVYSTKSELDEKLLPADLALIRDYDYKEIYDVSPSVDDDGKLLYEVSLYKTNEYTGEYVLEDYCILNSGYRILEGGLFEGKGSLTQREFDLICGNFEQNYEILKYQYQTLENNERTLVFISPKFNMDAYNKVLDDANMLWYVFVLVLFIVIIIQSVMFSRKIRNSLKPLDAAIVSYGSGQHSNISLDEVPKEFRHIVNDFEELQHRLDHAKAEKEHEEQERYRMIANISHDLKTPLTAIQGYSKAFCDGMVLPEKKELYMKTIYQKSKVCSELMDTFFEFAKLQHPDFMLNLETVNLTEFVREYLGEKYVEFEIHDFRMEPDIPEKTVMCTIDTKLMRRVLNNLTENALKYNPKGTTVYYSVREENQLVYLTIADKGIGIPEEIRNEVFEPFVTGDSARTTGSGTGFGMTIAKKIIELHGGTIRLKTPPLNGYSTEFEIILHK